MSQELREAIDDYDRSTARARLGGLVKSLRARGVVVTELRESLDQAGLPARMRMIAGERLVWEYVRLDVALDEQQVVDAKPWTPIEPTSPRLRGALEPDVDDDSADRPGFL